jgi:hypothetical protein
MKITWKFPFDFRSLLTCERNFQMESYWNSAEKLQPGSLMDYFTAIPLRIPLENTIPVDSTWIPDGFHSN